MSNRKKIEPGLTSRNRGRPTLPEEERKQARNLSVSPLAWQGLEAQLSAAQVKTVSELLEKIGTYQIQLVARDSSLLADVPIYRRLKSLISEPVAVFWSLLAFVVRLRRQLELEVSDEAIYSVTMKACTIVFYIGYTHPDVLINNPSALLRWLCYRIALAEKMPVIERIEEPPSVVDASAVERQFRKISNALHVLEMAARSPDYEALKMKVIDGLTIKQISRIFKLQKLDVSKAEVSYMIKKGLANFRQLLYGHSSDHNLQEDNSAEISSSVLKYGSRLDVLQDARCYIRLALQESLLDLGSQRAIEEILLKTGKDPYLDFWLNEIDYDLERKNIKIRNRISETLEDEILRKKAEIDPELTFCRTRDQMRQILEKYAEQEAGTKLPLNHLLGEVLENLVSS